jgi:hypothetical protein
MHGLSTIISMNAARAGAEAKARRDHEPPPIPRSKRTLGWFTDAGIKKLADELRGMPQTFKIARGGKTAGEILRAVEQEIDYRKREDRIVKAMSSAPKE